MLKSTTKLQVLHRKEEVKRIQLNMSNRIPQTGLDTLSERVEKRSPKQNEANSLVLTLYSNGKG